MTPERYKELQRFGDKLTKEEIAEGWHYCLEWDDMLCHPEWEEARVCKCEVKEFIPNTGNITEK